MGELRQCQVKFLKKIKVKIKAVLKQLLKSKSKRQKILKNLKFKMFGVFCFLFWGLGFLRGLNLIICNSRI